ncbi:MAG: spo0J [Clostridia bacterium]|nr:spo0J [Clostridia bacterium]
MKKENKALGKGLSALFTDNNIDEPLDEKQIKLIKISDIEPNKEQPRKYFDKEKLDELARSLSEHGLLQPLIVRPTEDNNRYTRISGERRWRAARMAGLLEVSVLIKDIDDKSALEIGLIENLQREDLNIIEEAKGYKSLLNDYDLTQEEISKRVGKSRPVIANALRILALPDEIIKLIEKGELTAGHARAMLPLMEKFDTKKLLEIAEQIINKNLTVRDLENMAKKIEKKEEPPVQKINDIYFKEVEKDISEVWGRKVKIISSRNKGKIELEFYNKDDFDILIELLKSNNFNDNSKDKY